MLCALQREIVKALSHKFSFQHWSILLKLQEGESSPCTGHDSTWWVDVHTPFPILNHYTMWLYDQRHASAALTPGRQTLTQWVWARPTAGLDVLAKRKIPCLCQGSNLDPSGGSTRNLLTTPTFSLQSTLSCGTQSTC